MASARVPVYTAASKRGMALLQEFKNFALKGNVVDLAVAVVIGGAFGKIVDSLVKHIIMPLVSMLLPTDQSYLQWKLVARGTEVPYGLFIGEVVNFLIVALAIYIFIVKFLGFVLKAKRAEAPAAAPPPPTPEQQLLAEIRDLLKTQKA